MITLFFVAPFVAEYLLGDLPLKLLPVILIMAPMYGGGAVLIRETARHMGRGWPTMLLLGTAYTLLEEGFVTQSLFNPDYLKMHMHLLQPAHIAALGMGGWWTLFMFNLHTFWSIAVSIALVEGLFPARRTTTWLGHVGDFVVALIFVLGTVANWAIGYKQNDFVASHLQFAGVGMGCVVLIVAVLLVRGRSQAPVRGAVPRPWIIGEGAFVLGMGVLIMPPL